MSYEVSVVSKKQKVINCIANLAGLSQEYENVQFAKFKRNLLATHRITVSDSMFYSVRRDMIANRARQAHDAVHEVKAPEPVQKAPQQTEGISSLIKSLKVLVDKLGGREETKQLVDLLG